MRANGRRSGVTWRVAVAAALVFGPAILRDYRRRLRRLEELEEGASP